MQSASDKVNTDNTESLFDFLDSEDDKHAERSSSRPAREQTFGSRGEGVARSGSRDPNANKPFPVIRKPVSVERSGPLRAPRPGDPVEAPPALTDALQASPARQAGPTAAAQHPGRGNKNTADFADLDLDLDLDFGDDDWPSSDQWIDDNARRSPMSAQRGRTSFVRKLGYVLATLLILAGIGTGLYSVPQGQTWMDQTMATGKSLLGLDTALNADATDVNAGAVDFAPTPSATPAIAGETESSLNTPTAATEQTLAVIEEPQANAPKSLNTLFKEELARLEALLEQGAVDEAESVLRTMDRAVYGYGAPEFTEIKERIAQVKGTDDGAENAAAEQLAQQQAIAAEAARVELQRVEQERAAAEALRIDAQRVAQANAAAEAERQRLEAQRVAQANAAAEAEAERQTLEAERLEALQREQNQQISASEQIRADRLTQEQARLEQLEAARQERAVLEQERLAQQQLAAEESAQQAAASEAYQPGESQAVDEPESVEQVAARQREAARQQRLIDARGGDAATQEQLAFVEPVVTVPTQAAAPQPITDGDLQRVYGQFSQLQKAIENRDVNAVIQLTERSGIRVQQMMQMFQNNVSIQTRLRNVSTLDAAGEIQGTLQIIRLEREDGSVTGPPLNLGSIRLSSTRQGDDWSAIRW